MVDFSTSLIAQSIILFLDQRDGKNDDDDDDDVDDHDDHHLTFDIWSMSKDLLGEMLWFLFFLQKAPLTACFIPEFEPELVYHGKLCLDKSLTSLLDISTLIDADSLF